ncbi:MAG: hypothetical protein CME13_16965 [Gemmatimonadetes bacterium]|nr:hypothetical protein [Gemmatimonadota bacterium]
MIDEGARGQLLAAQTLQLDLLLHDVVAHVSQRIGRSTVNGLNRDGVHHIGEPISMQAHIS